MNPDLILPPPRFKDYLLFKETITNNDVSFLFLRTKIVADTDAFFYQRIMSLNVTIDNVPVEVTIANMENIH